MRLWIKSVQVAATFVGTIVGAGFASGQEIVAFFTAYGHAGTWGIWISTGLFMWLGYRLMVLAHQLGTPSYESFNRQLFGSIPGRIINLLVFLTLLGVTTVMLAGAGSVLEEQFDFPYFFGILATAVAAALLLRKGLERLLAINSIVVPSMLLFAFLILMDGDVVSPIPETPPDSLEFLWQAVLYVSFNLAMAQAVLVPIGHSIKEPIVLKRAGIIGGGSLGFLMLSSHIAMLANWEQIRYMEVPIIFITGQWNDWLQLFFVFVLYSEIFTTLISNVFGIGQQIRELVNIPVTSVYFALFTASSLLCFIGYSDLLLFLYPLFGYLGLATFIKIMLPKRSISALWK
ncbi:hypothetical protein [Brevibacillus borstelensis]|uniref:YkvI family membrane protein n=1 Tax=Brevibacillus borstelensis TaxID=45462 RepID=UPI0030C54DDB